MTTASRAIEKDSNARTATRALKVLSENLQTVRNAVVENNKRRSEPEDFAFTYEEEADPEIFFVPYVWEVIVCVLTSTSIEWNKGQIRVFPLLDEEPEEEETENGSGEFRIPQFAQDVSDVA